MLVRTSKDKDNPYVMLNKAFLEDTNLSLKAKGLLAFCMTKQDGWQFNVQHLTSVLKEGREAIYSAFNELIEHGYCHRKQKHKDNGDFGKSEYILYETSRKFVEEDADLPYTQNPHALAHTGFTDTLSADAVPYILVSNEYSNNKESIGTPSLTPHAPASKNKKSERQPFVITSDHEHAQLIKKYGETKTLQAYEKLSLWKQNTSKSKWKKNDYLSIQNWVVNALDEEAHKKKKFKSEEAVEALENENERIHEHRSWFRHAIRKIKSPSKEWVVDYSDYVSFTGTNTTETKIFFKEDKFKELVKQELVNRKYKLEK